MIYIFHKLIIYSSINLFLSLFIHGLFNDLLCKLISVHQLIYLSIPKATPFSHMLSTHNVESIDAGEETGGSLMEAFTPELR